jgi:transcriptional regulator with XRE-family HTH domain
MNNPQLKSVETLRPTPFHAKRPSLIDQDVGARIRFQRMSLGMSQEKLADVLGITFQQVQKYEKGKNRIGAGRLLEISRALTVPITFFYEDSLAGSPEPEGKTDFQKFLAMREGVALAKAFVHIENHAIRQGLVVLAQAAATLKEEPAPILAP